VEAGDEAGHVDGRGRGLDLGERLEHAHGVLEGEFDVAGLAGEAVRLEQVDRGGVDQPSAVDGGHHPVAAVEAADERDHPLGELLPGDPFLTAGFELVAHIRPFSAARDGGQRRPHSSLGMFRIVSAPVSGKGVHGGTSGRCKCTRRRVPSRVAARQAPQANTSSASAMS
jgi:hypothetical protein